MGAKPLLLVSVLFFCFHLCSCCTERESQALLTFKRSLIDPSSRLASWVGQYCCKWRGVKCNNETGHVSELDLGSYILGEDRLVGNEVNPSLFELKHLEYLDISSNNFSGSEIPKFIVNFTKLRYLNLYNSIFGGTVPSSLGQLSKLEWLDLSSNSLTGVVSEIHFHKLSRLETLYLDDDSLVFNVSSNWTPPFHLHTINLHSCLVGPRFPNWLRTQSTIENLLLANTSISDSIPKWFSSIASNFQYVDLSNNHIRGLVPDLSHSMISSDFYLFLSSNSLEGPLPHFPSNTIFIDLSNNFISGSLPHNIGGMMPNLEGLKLSNNSISGSIPTSLCDISELVIISFSNNNFSGEIPKNCWSNLKYRGVMAFTNNKLTGVIPSSNFGNLCGLSSLRLGNNNFYGELPMALRKCESLRVLDVSENKFSGNISWIGGFRNLRILSLRSNKFEGNISPELCHANNIRILDLAENKFSGTINPCFSNFSGMKLGAKMIGLYSLSYHNQVIQRIKGRKLNYTSTLPYLVNLDLSSNNFEGLIPGELTLLSGLRGFNLSNNHLTGEIPKEIGNLKLLESLDFSDNLLSGTIPQSISNLPYISYLDLSYNNLSGRIPTGNQLQTLDSSSYEGNLGLCGTPTEKMCVDDAPLQRNDTDRKVKVDGIEIFQYYISMIIGFVTGLCGVWVALFCKKTWRETYYHLVENVHDQILMKFIRLCRG